MNTITSPSAHPRYVEKGSELSPAPPPLPSPGLMMVNIGRKRVVYQTLNHQVTLREGFQLDSINFKLRFISQGALQATSTRTEEW